MDSNDNSHFEKFPAHTLMAVAMLFALGVGIGAGLGMVLLS